MYDNDEKPLYLLYLIQRSRYSFGIKWKNVKNLIIYLFGDNICSNLINDKFMPDDNAMEMIMENNY